MDSIVTTEDSFLSGNTLTTTIISAISFSLLAGYYYYSNLFSYWRKRGVKGPNPIPFLGNFGQLVINNRFKLDQEWVVKYGKVYGFYQGSKPQLIIADAEVLQQICIKDFDSFQDHQVSEFANKFQKHFLFMMQGDHWKKVRALMSPTFTSGKIKRMFKFIDVCADDLVDCFREQLTNKKDGERSAVVNVKDLYSLFTMDTIATCCYGIKLQRGGTSNLKSAASRDEFIKSALGIFESSLTRIAASVLIPKPILRLMSYKIAPEENFEPLRKKTQLLINDRRKTSKKFDDYLQLLLDAKLDDELELNELDQEENHHAGLTREALIADQNKMVDEVKTKSGAKVILSDMEVLSGGMLILAVGLETTSLLLSTTSYALAFNHNVQEKLYEELLKIVECNEDKTKYSFDYDAITSCRYLDAVLSESLRLLTPVLQIDRSANRDYHIEKYNIDVPKGMRLMISIHAVHNDPDYWEEPDKFKPERFLPENKHKIVPGSYCPFGLGPRHCIGMRFSLTEAKLALAKMVMNFKFDKLPDSPFPPKLGTMVRGLIKIDPQVKIIPRAQIQH